MKGFIKFVEPSNYQNILDYAYDNTENGIVFAITGLGDFFLWENDESGGAIRLVNFRYGDDHIVGVKDDIDWFLEKNLASDFYVTKFYKEKNYFLAREQYGEPAFDECFGYIPLLGMGGPEKVENMEKVKIIEHI